MCEYPGCEESLHGEFLCKEHYDAVKKEVYALEQGLCPGCYSRGLLAEIISIDRNDKYLLYACNSKRHPDKKTVRVNLQFLYGVLG
jgi:hypothetical protein